jgi:hypothetical protein
MRDMLKNSTLVPLVLIILVVVGSFIFSGATQLNACHVRVLRSSCESSAREVVAGILSIILIALAAAITEDNRTKHLGQATRNILAASSKSYDPLIESLSQGILHPKLFGNY